LISCQSILADPVVDLVQQRLIALAHSQSAAIHVDRHIVLFQAQARHRAGGILRLQNRVIIERALDTAELHVADHVATGVVSLEFLEDAQLLDRLEVVGAGAGAGRLAGQVLRAVIDLGIGLLDDQALAEGDNHVGEVHHLGALGGRRHAGHDQIDLVGREGRDQRGKRNRLEVHLEARAAPDLVDYVRHEALDSVGFHIQEAVGFAGGRRAGAQDLGGLGDITGQQAAGQQGWHQAGTQGFENRICRARITRFHCSFSIMSGPCEPIFS
jgi:hypothetical protein